MRSSAPTVGPVIFPKPYATVRVSATCDDPGLKVQMLAGSNMFSLTGTVASGGKALNLAIDGLKVALPLSKGMSPERVVESLKGALPPGYSVVALTSTEGGLNLRVAKTLVPKGPKIEVSLANDPSQRVMVTGNQIHIVGTACNSGVSPSMLNLMVEGQRVSLQINAGDEPKAVAQSLAAALPPGFKGQLDVSGASAVLTLVRV